MSKIELWDSRVIPTRVSTVRYKMKNGTKNTVPLGLRPPWECTNMLWYNHDLNKKYCVYFQLGLSNHSLPHRMNTLDLEYLITVHVCKTPCRLHRRTI